MRDNPPPRVLVALRLLGNEPSKIGGNRKAQNVDVAIDEFSPEFLSDWMRDHGKHRLS